MVERKSHVSYRESHSEAGYGVNYDGHFTGDSFNARVWELEKNVLENMLNRLYRGARIQTYLDFACGTGRVCGHLESRVDHPMGLDITDEMINVAKQRCSKTEFITGDITKESLLEGRTFNLITAFRFFLNAENSLRDEVLTKIRTLLDADGFLVFNIHGNASSFRHLAILFSKCIGRKTNTNEMSLGEIRRLLQSNGFQFECYSGVNYLPQFCGRLLPRKSWLFIERFLGRIIPDMFAMNLIIAAKRNGKEKSYGR